MTRVRFFILLLGLIGVGTSLACGGAGEIALPSAELTEPWTKMNLPTKDGTVLVSTSTSLSVQHKGEKVSEIADKYIAAIEKAKFKKQHETKGDSVAVTFKGKKGNCSLAVTAAAGNTLVAIAMQ
jgi:hypothetical protein